MAKLEIPREKCVELMNKYVSSEGQKHLFAMEVAMAALAKHLGEDEHTWAMCGLLHDIDYEQIFGKEDMERHMREHCGEMTTNFLKEINFPEDLIMAIRAHNEVQNLPRDSKLAKAIFATDGLTGFITAVAKIYPDQKLVSVKIKSITKRLNEARFAAAVNRDHIRSCESELGIELNKFIEIVFEAMKTISDKLGL